MTLVDLPDHGRSPWTDGFDYLAFADLVAGLLSPDDPVALVGHSMGGKVAMLVALRHPALVERLCVVDVAPVAYDHGREFEGYIAAMRASTSPRSSRAEADAALLEAVPYADGARLPAPEPAPRGRRVAWQVNLDVLGRDLDLVTGWPEVDAAPYDGPVLWVGGADSRYVAPEHVAAMDRLFPRNRRVTVKGAGHWVHSEQPEVFLEVLRRFVSPAAG